MAVPWRVDRVVRPLRKADIDRVIHGKPGQVEKLGHRVSVISVISGEVFRMLLLLQLLSKFGELLSANHCFCATPLQLYACPLRETSAAYRHSAHAVGQIPPTSAGS